ncbi:MAG: 16S rRNA (cytosine(1402)-N(4))-methyltransferase RsmH [Nitrospinota bacterium]
MAASHIPVMAKEVADYLAPGPGQVFLDCTLGGGGHSWVLLEASSPSGVLVGFDRDGEAVTIARERLAPFGGRARLRRAEFARLREVLRGEGIERVDGVLFDLGVSSLQLDDPARGFSFQIPGELDMRMDRRQALSAREVVNELSEEEFVRILRAYGEEPRARPIARHICRARARAPIRTTQELARLVAEAVPRRFWRPGRHPATRTFQALRIHVNRELEGLADSLREAIGVLRAGGRLCVLSYHSLEDRIAKQTLREEARGCAVPRGAPVGGGRPPRVRILTPRPLRPPRAEVRANPRARSAKLRVAERLPGG